MVVLVACNRSSNQPSEIKDATQKVYRSQGKKMGTPFSSESTMSTAIKSAKRMKKAR